MTEILNLRIGILYSPRRQRPEERLPEEKSLLQFNTFDVALPHNGLAKLLALS